MQFSSILEENHPALDYHRRTDQEKHCISYGQRKLLLSLISFLSKYCVSIKNCVIVYVGAAPGNNIKIAADLFKDFNFTFHLYDPLQFRIKTNIQENFFIYQKLFTDETAEYWAKKREEGINIVFISDIRTADHTKAETLKENEDQIDVDMNMQKKWVSLIKPLATQLKFRLPYSIEGIKDEYEYFDGVLTKSAYAPQSSTETRLSFTDIKYKTYSCKKYESQMFYHNSIIREKKYLRMKKLMVSN